MIWIRYFRYGKYPNTFNRYTLKQRLYQHPLGDRYVLITTFIKTPVLSAEVVLTLWTARPSTLWPTDNYSRDFISHLHWPHQSTQTYTWWRHQMETFSALLTLCAGNSPVPGEFPAQRPVTRSFDVFFDLRPNKRLSKQLWGWWCETLSYSLWRHCNVYFEFLRMKLWFPPLPQAPVINYNTLDLLYDIYIHRAQFTDAKT